MAASEFYKLNILEGQGKVTKLLLTGQQLGGIVGEFFISFFCLTPYSEGTIVAKKLVDKHKI